MRQPIKATILGLLLTFLLLLLGGTCACEQARDHGHIEVTAPEEQKVHCKRVVGCTLCETKVFFCRDYERDTCFYLNAKFGGIALTECYKHPFAKPEKEER